MDAQGVMTLAAVGGGLAVLLWVLAIYVASAVFGLAGGVAVVLLGSALLGQLALSLAVRR